VLTGETLIFKTLDLLPGSNSPEEENNWKTLHSLCYAACTIAPTLDLTLPGCPARIRSRSS